MSEKTAPWGVGLTAKQRSFCLFYVESGNGRKAAERAGYAGNDVTLRSVASENLAKPHIRHAIGLLWRESGLTPDEIIGRLSAQARGELATKTRKVTGGPQNGATIEECDALSALDKLAKAHDLYSETVVNVQAMILVGGLEDVEPA